MISTHLEQKIKQTVDVDNEDSTHIQHNCVAVCHRSDQKSKENLKFLVHLTNNHS